MKIRINKIFGKYDNEIDLDKKINIFIGENGIGKSTTINILNKLLKFDYKRLLDYYFDSIDIIDGDENIKIEYRDVMLTNEALIIDFLGDDYFLYRRIKEEFETLKQKKSFRDVEKNAGRYIDVNDFISWMLKEENESLYTEMINSDLNFTYWYDYELFLNNIDNRLLYKILKFDSNLLRNETLIKNFENSSEYINMILETYNDYTKLQLYDKKKYFNNTKYKLISEKITKFIKNLYFDKVLYIDMVSHFVIINDFNRLQVKNDLEYSKVSSNTNVKYNTYEIDDLFAETEFPPQEPHLRKYKDIEYCNQLKKNYVTTYNDNYSDDLFIDIVSYISKSGVNDKFIDDFRQFLNSCNQLRDKNIVDFGYLLYNHIYTNEKINEFKIDFYSFLNKFIDDFRQFLNSCNQLRDKNIVDFGYLLYNHIYTNEKINEFKIDFYSFLNKFSNTISTENYNISDKTYNKIKCYLRPLLNSNNAIAQVFDKIFTLNDSTRFLYREELNFLGAFYNKFKDKYFDINDEKLNLLNSLFKQYFTNKEVKATPFGILISTKDYENDINFEELSSGEKKIIILFMFLVFSKNQIILLDEPEASLSIVWQENLLKDIINNFDFNKIIVATQSPYIIESEDLDDYIIPLIDGEQNE